MRPVSDRFLKVSRESHKPCFRARVVTGMPTGVEPAGVDIPILDGDVQLDANANIRGTLDLTTDGSLWPADDTDLINPYGTELHISRGIEYGGGDREWVSQGYFRIYSVDRDDAPKGGPIRIEARDRMSGIIDARLESPVQFAEATAVSTVFDTLVLDVYPDAEILYDFDAGAITFPGSHIAEQDRYAFLLDVVKALGKVMYWDYEGKLRVEDAPALSTSAVVFDVTHGAHGVLVSMQQSRSREGVFNAFVVTGEAPGDQPAVRAVARDMSPTSPTYWLGPFGKVPKFYSSPFITDVGQAAAAAAALLVRNLGRPYNVSFGMVPNAALEPLDVVRVSYRDDAPVELHVLEKLNIPLTAAGLMSAQTRERSSEEITVEELL
jgi:hypothetical protein